MLYRSYIKPLSVETTQGARARSPGPFGLARLAAGGVLQAREDVDAHGHQTSGQAEQQDRLLSDLGNDGARQGEHIRHGVNGFLFETGNDEALKNILLYLLEHSANIETMGRNARETAMNYTWENYGNKVVAELRNIGEMSK